MLLKLTDEQRGPHSGPFPGRGHSAASCPGRHPVPVREVLNAALWILATSAQWHMLPQSHPNYKTVHRRFRQWRRSEVLRDVPVDPANNFRESGRIDEREGFVGSATPPTFLVGCIGILLKQF